MSAVADLVHNRKLLATLIVSIIGGIALMAIFANVEVAGLLSKWTRHYESWDLDEIVACLLALTIVLAWFAVRRWRDVGRRNQELRDQSTKLADAFRKRRVMEEQLRDASKTAIVDALAGRFAGELSSGLVQIRMPAEAGIDNHAAPQAKARLQRIAKTAQHGRDIINRLLALGDERMCKTQPVDAVDAGGRIRSSHETAIVGAHPARGRAHIREQSLTVTLHALFPHVLACHEEGHRVVINFGGLYT